MGNRKQMMQDIKRLLMFLKTKIAHAVKILHDIDDEDIKTFFDRNYRIARIRLKKGLEYVRADINHEESRFSDDEYTFMQSRSAAVLEKTPTRMIKVLRIWLATIFIIITWATFTEIEEITRGSGDVVPSGSNQVLQSLEGGIIKDILIKEGERVKADQVLVHLTNTKAKSSLESNKVRIQELEAKSKRLKAEAQSLPFIYPENQSNADMLFLNREYSLYLTHKNEFQQKDHGLREQINQLSYEYSTKKTKLKHYRSSLALHLEEIAMTEPMVKEGIRSRVDFLKLKREKLDFEQKVDAVSHELPSLISQIKELENKRKELMFSFKNEAKLGLNEISSELERLYLAQDVLKDQYEQTVISSPVDGIVQKLHTHTVGGVIRPGSDIIEIVPTDDKLLLEVKIKPADIAFIHPGAKAVAKFSAYDFSIHGGLDGEIVRISPDTIFDEKDGTYYLIYVRTDRSYLGTKDQPLEIIPGMTVNVDIVTGKKSIMQYIFKPILKSKQYIFSER